MTVAKAIEAPLDLRGWELQRAVVQNSPTDPGTGKPGQIYFNSASLKVKVCTNATGPVWVDIDDTVDATTLVKGVVQLTGDLAGTATAPVVQHFTLTSDAAAGAHKITGLANPSAAQDAMTLNYADANYAGLGTFLNRDAKDSVKAVSVANAALASAYENGDTLDGVVLATGNRILLTAQTTATENGIYTVNASGAPSRATDALTTTQLTLGAQVFVEGNPGVSSYDRTIWTFSSGTFAAQVWTTSLFLGGNTGGNFIDRSAGGLRAGVSQFLVQNTIAGDSFLIVDSGSGQPLSQGLLNLTGRDASGVAKAVQFVGGVAGDLSITPVSGQNVAFGNSPRLTGLHDPTSAQDAMTKNYGDTNYLGSAPFNQRDFKDSVKAASFTNGTLATAYVAGATLDGYTLVLGDRILLAGQTTAAEKGIYTVTAGTPTRTADAATGTELGFGATTWVENGTLWGGAMVRLTNSSFTTQQWDTGINPGGGSQNAVHGNASGINVFSQNAISLFTNSVSSPPAMTLTSTGVGLKNRTTPAAAIDIDDSTSAAGGIAFGGNQFQLYKSAANSLKLNASALLDLTSVARTDHGTTGFSSFGAAATDTLIKKDAAGVLAVRLGDDSGYGGLKAGTGNFTGTLAANGGLSVAAAQTIAMGANRVTGVADPTSAQDAVTKVYVDNLVQGLAPKAAVRAVTTGVETYTISAGAVTVINGTTIDGVSPAVGERILVKNAPTASGVGGGAAQTSTSFPANGIYIVTNATTNLTISRATDADSWAELVGALIPTVAGGTANGDTVWLSTTTPGGTINTNNVAFTIFSNATVIVGDNVYITRSGNTIQPAAIPGDPTAGANGSVVATAGALSRQMRFALKGDGAATSFTCTHSFGNRAVWAIGFLDSAGAPAQPVEIDYIATSTSAISVTFPVAPTAGTIYYVQVIG